MPNSKFSSLIRAGSIVHTIDGGVYRCMSKIACGGETHIRLANLQGTSVPTPVNLRPISPALARFASWMRWVVAYNKDFDLYVKEYIRAAGLPVDPAMDWSKMLQTTVTPRLVSKDPEVQDEALHHLIIKLLVERSILSNFNTAIAKFPPHVQALPLEKQVNAFLLQNFIWYIGKANSYIKQVIFQDDANSMFSEGTAGHEGEDINTLDTEEHATGTQAYDAIDSDVDVQTFLRGFVKYLSDRFRKETVAQYVALFNVLYAHLREGDLPSSGLKNQVKQIGEDGEPIIFNIPTLYDEWKEEIGITKSHAWFKVLFSNLPKLIDTYVTHNLHDEEVNTFIEVMQNIGKEQKKVEVPSHPVPAAATASVMGGLKLAEEDFPINQTVESGSSDNNNSGGMSLGDLGSSVGDAGEAASGAGEALEALAPLAVVATQWEVPKCKSCGKESNRDCPACQEKFCGDCMLNHHANNPSHDRIASAKKKAALDKLIDDFVGL